MNTRRMLPPVGPNAQTIGREVLQAVHQAGSRGRQICGVRVSSVISTTDCTILLDPRQREHYGIAEWARIPFNWLVWTATEQRMLFARSINLPADSPSLPHCPGVAYPDFVDIDQGLAIVSVRAGELYGHDMVGPINSVLPRGSKSALIPGVNYVGGLI